MDRKDLISKVAGNIAAATPGGIKEDPENIHNMYKDMKDEEDAENIGDEVFEIKMPMFTGEVYVVDARNVDWASLNVKSKEMKENEENIRGMVHALITADHVGHPEEVDAMVTEFDQALTNFITGFGINPSYDKLDVQVRPYVLVLGKCFDALTLVNVMMHHTAIHHLASQIFSIDQSIKDVANLNDLTDMNSMADGLISEDREKFEGPDDHDVSGLISE